MHTNSSQENRLTNSFAASFTVVITFFAGFFVSAVGVVTASVPLAITGLLILLGGAGLQRLLLI